MADKQVLQERAAALLELHQPGNPVVLPTVWDAWSAKLAVDAGFAALTVGSHPVADSIGKPDNEGMTFDDLLARVVQITDAVRRPGVRRHRVRIRRGARPSHRRPARCRGGGPEHRGHRAQRGRPAAVVARTRGARRRAACRRRRRRRACGDQRAHRSVHPPGRRRVRPRRPGHRAADRSRRRRRRRRCIRSAVTTRIRCGA